MIRKHIIVIAAGLLAAAPAFPGSVSFFQAGNLVVSVEGNGVYGATGVTTYGDNQAAPLTLFQYAPTGTSSVSYVNSLVLPQTQSGSNLPVSGEYGSSSEGTLQLSGNGQFLTIGGYGVNAATYNAGTTTALAQSTNTSVPRVAVTIDANGNVNSSTGLTNVFNQNNIRSVYSTDGTSFYVSGQGLGGSLDNTGGVFYATLGSSTATSITGNDEGSGLSQDTRDVQIYNNTLYVSADSKSGSINRDYIGTLGAAGTPPTTVANNNNGPAMLTGFGNTGGTGKITLNAQNENGVNGTTGQVNLSPEGYFFASPSVLYVADSGSPKNDSTVSSGTSLGDGGLQKWVNSKPDGTGTWSLEYTISSGLNLVANTSTYVPNTNQTTGLYGLTGEVVGNNVYLYATSYTLSDLDNSFLFGITDSLSATTKGTEAFTVLDTAPSDSNFRGVALAPQTPEPATFAMIGMGLLGVFAIRRRKAL
jgi:hypothetical protein